MTSKEKNKLTGESLRAEIENACRGLVYVSETDAEILAVLDTTGRLSATEFVGTTSGTESSPASEFFARLTKERDWHGDSERRSVRRFMELEMLLAANLEKLRMFRLGHIQVEIFVLGYDAKGSVCGIQTKAVET
ncbi:MAG: nuclease A inhibitor family protein [Pyrinomonadaceae bacterium]